jgi:ParB family chromosome partitioning protein
MPIIDTAVNKASEICITGSGKGKFNFVGPGVFEDGQIRCEDDKCYVDRIMLDIHVLNKLEMIANAVMEAEGWAWCLHRMWSISLWDSDAQEFGFLPEPAPLFSPEERARTSALTVALQETETHDDEYEIQQQIEDLDAAAVIRSWTTEQKAKAGVVVSFARGEVCIQRGILLKEHSI